MASSSEADPARERRLIEQLELRIASADSDAKFESLIQKFLPALVLKLASEHDANRNLALKVCQYVNQRLKISQQIQLPIPGLLKNFKEAQNAFVRNFSLLFIQQGMSRINPKDAIDLLPEIMRFSIPLTPDFDAASRKMWSIAFRFLLDTLQSWRAPDRGTKEDEKFKEAFALTDFQTQLLCSTACRFLLFDPKHVPTNNSLDEDFREVFEHHWKQRSKVLPRLSDFLFTAIFTDAQRLVPATILSVDSNPTASITGDTMFKQCIFDLEDETAVAALFSLYEVARPKLQTRILNLLSRSQLSTTKFGNIDAIVDKQLGSQSTGLEAVKHTAAVFTYLTWAVRVSPNISEIGSKVQGRLKEYIELQGWPNMNERSAAEIELRAKAYESIGLLAGKTPRSSVTIDNLDIDLVNWLFTSLRCDTTSGIRGSIEEALSMSLNAITELDDNDKHKLRSLLLWNIKAQPGDEDPLYFFPTVNSTAYISVRFANKCFPFDDATSRLIDVIATGMKDRRELTEEGIRGLDPYWHHSNQKLVDAHSLKQIKRPKFADLTNEFFGNPGNAFILQNGAMLATAAGFCHDILISEALNSTADSIDDSPDWSNRIDALINNNRDSRSAVSSYLRTLPHEPVASYLRTQLVGFSMHLSRCAELAIEILSLLGNDAISTVSGEVLTICSKCLDNTSLQQLAARCIGIAGSLDRGSSIKYMETFTSKRPLQPSDIGAQSVSLLGQLLAAVQLLSHFYLRHREEPTSGITLKLIKTLEDVCVNSTDSSTRNSAFSSIGQLALCLGTYHDTDIESEKLIEKLLNESKKGNEKAVSALGRLINYEATTQPVESIVEKMFSLHEIKQAEFHFALGEAFAVSCAGFSSQSTITEFDVDVKSPDWGFHESHMRTLLDKMIESCQTTKPTLKKAAAIWLLSMVQYCGDLDPVKDCLRQCQAVFARLLTDRDEVVQETGSRGLSIVYEKGDKRLRDDLVRDLVQHFTSSGPKMSGTVSEDTELFETGALPTEGGQSVTTYKDIVSLATEMGDPSLVYKFMNLASNNAIWTSRAAFGRFGLSNVLAESSYLTENKKFYPKLFRYRFDPNPNVRRSMEDIWKALVKDPNAVLDENFDLIMDDLLKSVVSGKEWRAREASCAAIADLLSGREVEKYEKYLDDIWKVAFKVLDDVKGSVRKAAMELCRTLTNMLIRNLEVGQGTSHRATKMLDHALPFLLQQMDAGAAQEVQQYATITLLDVVKKSPPRSLQSFASVILETFINSLSSLESASINYLHLNADKYGMTTGELDKMRVSSLNTSPLSEAIDRCLESLTMESIANPDDMQDVQSEKTPMQDGMRRLEATFKTAIGLPSKVGLSRVLVTLVVRYPIAFRPYADRFAQLTRKHILDRNATISVAFSTSLGYLMRLASEKEVLSTVTYAKKLYFESQELSHRAVAGEILQAISKTSNDVFMNYASSFLPFAFVGRNDTDEEVRKLFDPPWKDNIGGSRAVELYVKELTEILGKHIKSSLWPIRHACCLAVADLVTSVDGQGQWTEVDARLIWPLMEEALGGKTWEGKEKVIVAFPKFVKRASTLWNDKPISTKMQQIALREAKRTNISYRKSGVEALRNFAETRTDLDMSVEIVTHFETLVEEMTNEDVMDVDDDAGDAISRTSTIEATLVEIVACVFSALPTRPTLNVLDSAMKIVSRAQSQRSNVIDAAVYDSLARYVSKLTETSEVEGGQQTTNQKSEENISKENEAESIAAFLDKVILAATSHDSSRTVSSESEYLRKSRVGLVLALSRNPDCNVATRARLASILDGWHGSERSRQLRDDLDSARQNLRKPTS